ncbi:pirin family protein [Emticicia sp. CRIBPO]|uniref:pirin family protein n=1 Tax=Emticicia sp. CRIBPO TaxID=2683258 RepID=UPI00141307EA|nr:pirin-like C-terminal cupin domain-containing protein [Emticicia sp. CRIBPO]NBA86660.1 pirin family protein [Emticicia sp. CRIBPO]
MKQRTIARIVSTHAHQGFLGEGHTAAAVIDGSNFSTTDPFILLMDDRLDLPGGPPVGSPHPHAGFETVTLVLQGNEKDWKTGSLEVMTAGKGIIHTEEITAETKMRILQLWLVLPPDKRWAQPFLQQLPSEEVPVIRTRAGEIRIYSGSSNGVSSPLHHQTPFTLVDFNLESGREVNQEIPASYNGFVYVLEGNLKIGETNLEEGQVGWFDRPEGTESSQISFGSGEKGARFVLYAGEPQEAEVISHGPFIGDSQDDIRRLYREFRHGEMPHLNDLPENQKIKHRRAVAGTY